MKKRVIENWQSSLIGFVLLAIASVALFQSIVTWKEYVSFLPFALGWIYVQDTIFKIKP